MIDYATLLRDHVTLKCRSIDRIFLQAYVPKLQTVGEVCTFLRWQRKFPIPSSAAFGKIGEEYVKAVYRFAEAHHIPVVHFKKRQNKEEVARPYLEAAANEGKDRVVLIGIAQEQASVWRFWPRKGQEKAPTRTWTGAARWLLSTTSTFISGMQSGAVRSGKRMPTPLIRSGSG